MNLRLTLILMFLPLIATHAQNSWFGEVLAGPEWYRGSIMLGNDREVMGLVRYNDKNDIVCIETGRESRSFTARHVKGFEFFDEVEKKQRFFLSIPVEDPVNNVKRPLFFELEKELPGFAIMSKIAPIRMEKREYSTPAMFNPATGAFTSGRYYGYPTTFSYTETVFIYSREGDIRPILEIKEKEIDGMFFDRTVVKNRLVDEDALRRYTYPFYEELLEYARKNSLNLKDKTHLFQILAYYQTLLQ